MRGEEFDDVGDGGPRVDGRTMACGDGLDELVEPPEVAVAGIDRWAGC